MSDMFRRQRRRTAFTLVELMIGLTVSASVLTLSVKLIHRSLQQASEVRAQHNQIRSFTHFSELFRDDVHHAVELIVAEPDQIELRKSPVPGAERIKYQITDTGVHRTIEQAQQPTGFSALLLKSGLQAKFSLADSPQRVTLSVTQPLPGSENQAVSEPVCRHRVSAVLGLRAGDFKTEDLP